MEKTLKVSINKGVLHVEVGINHLLRISQIWGDFREEEDVRIIDFQKFEKELQTVLTDEEEDGTTLVHRMFDTALTNLAESGSESIVFPNE